MWNGPSYLGVSFPSTLSSQALTFFTLALFLYNYFLQSYMVCECSLLDICLCVVLGILLVDVYPRT